MRIKQEIREANLRQLAEKETKARIKQEQRDETMRAATAENVEHIEIKEEMQQANQREVERLKRSLDDEDMYEVITTVRKKKRKTAPQELIELD
jgi:hypothetical protein